MLFVTFNCSIICGNAIVASYSRHAEWKGAWSNFLPAWQSHHGPQWPISDDEQQGPLPVHW